MLRSIPLKGGAEFDALTRWKNYYSFKPGVRQEIKRKFNRRERRYIRKQLLQNIREYIEEREEET